MVVVMVVTGLLGETTDELFELFEHEHELFEYTNCLSTLGDDE